MTRLSQKIADRAALIAPRLLAWFDRNRRDLPWRRTKDPYRIWVSEIMLQQTQVPTVIPYYRCFLRAFPTVRRLASAPLDEVLRLWAGLGYYSRARNLHTAAKRIVEQHGGRFPASYEAIAALPGIGAYTAGAFLSIAFGLRLPAIDGNAARVLSRVFLVRGDVRAGRPKQKIEALGYAAVPDDRPGDHNQALMELGALICLPRPPRCEVCCLDEVCEARAKRLQDRIPPPRRSGVMRRVRMAVAVVRRRGRVLIAQRPEGGVWAGLWQFPSAELAPGQSPEAALRHSLSSDFGLEVEVGQEITSLQHGIMNQRIELTAYACKVLGGRTRVRGHADAKWVRPDELGEYAMPAPHRRVVTFVRRGAPGTSERVATSSEEV
jgi:A/G-specific adenine glycosylase